MALSSKIINLSVPKNFSIGLNSSYSVIPVLLGSNPPPINILLDNTIPSSMTRMNLSKALQSTETIRFVTVTILNSVFKKYKSILNEYSSTRLIACSNESWNETFTKYQDELWKRLPDIQIIYSLKNTDSISIDLLGNYIDCFNGYIETRFDYWKLMDGFDECLDDTKKSILKLVAKVNVKWNVNQSCFYTVAKLSFGGFSADCRIIMENLLNSLGVFTNREIGIWISCIELFKQYSEIDFILKWIDGMLTSMIKSKSKFNTRFRRVRESFCISESNIEIQNHYSNTFHFEDDQLPFTLALFVALESIKASKNIHLVRFTSILCRRILVETQAIGDIVYGFLKWTYSDTDLVFSNDIETLNQFMSSISEDKAWGYQEYLKSLIIYASSFTEFIIDSAKPGKKVNHQVQEGTVSILDSSLKEYNKSLASAITSQSSLLEYSLFIELRHPDTNTFFLSYDCIKHCWINDNIKSLLPLLSITSTTSVILNWFRGIESSNSLKNANDLKAYIHGLISIDNCLDIFNLCLLEISRIKRIGIDIDLEFIFDLFEVGFSCLRSNEIIEFVFNHPLIISRDSSVIKFIPNLIKKILEFGSCSITYDFSVYVESALKLINTEISKPIPDCRYLISQLEVYRVLISLENLEMLIDKLFEVLMKLSCESSFGGVDDLLKVCYSFNSGVFIDIEKFHKLLILVQSIRSDSLDKIILLVMESHLILNSSGKLFIKSNGKLVDVRLLFSEIDVTRILELGVNDIRAKYLGILASLSNIHYNWIVDWISNNPSFDFKYSVDLLSKISSQVSSLVHSRLFSILEVHVDLKTIASSLFLDDINRKLSPLIRIIASNQSLNIDSNCFKSIINLLIEKKKLDDISSYLDTFINCFDLLNCLANNTQLKTDLLTIGILLCKLQFGQLKKLPNEISLDFFSTEIEKKIGTLLMNCKSLCSVLILGKSVSLEMKIINKFIVDTLKYRLLDPRSLDLLEDVLKITFKVLYILTLVDFIFS